MKEYIGSGWGQLLQFNKLENFDAIWNLKADWFEKPNDRRGGWSGVSRIRLKTEKGSSTGIFLKRQENHNTRTWFSPVRGVPTFYREFKNILRFVANGIPTVEPVYYCDRYYNGKSQAILMTKELEGFEALDAAIYAREGVLMQDKVKREQIMVAVANGMRKMHEHCFQHGSLYGKHIFVGLVGSDWQVKFIDLEKLRRKPFKKQAMMKDLNNLSRSIPGWRRSDKLKFLKIYMQETQLSPETKLVWREIYNRMKAKNKI